MALPALAAQARGDSDPSPPRGSSGVRNPKIAPSNTRVPTVLGRGAAAYGRAREFAALVVWTLALFLALALASYQGGLGDGAPASVGADWVGPVGALCARGLVSLVGLVAWGLPV